jgi:hypothetical protein
VKLNENREKNDLLEKDWTTTNVVAAKGPSSKAFLVLSLGTN